MSDPRYPLLYQINTRVWLTELSESLNKTATLDDIPDAELDRLVQMGYEWIWMLSVWQTGEAAKAVSRSNSGWMEEFQHTLPDLKPEDIEGSGFAITGYHVHSSLGGSAALTRLRERLRARGLKLMLDFVPNHMALDHPWLQEHPDYFVSGSEEDLARAPKNFVKVKSKGQDIIKAYGRDPYFEGWPDTLQLDYSNPACQEAMLHELLSISDQCDGVRCDMAMLLLPDVFQRTWGRRPQDFWPVATQQVKEKHPGFIFMAEVYWDLEWTLQQQGFDYTYDKKLYDRLKEGHGKPVREHFLAAPDYQIHSARFMENHDEPRAAATFLTEQSKAAAVITYFCPGLRFFHQGQLEGRRKRISPHLVRAPKEHVDQALFTFYTRLLEVLKEETFRDGNWQLLETVPVSDGNRSFENYLSFLWVGNGKPGFLVIVNYSSSQSQCFLRVPLPELIRRQCTLKDLFSGVVYERDGTELITNGLYLDEPGWRYYAFELELS